MPLRIVELARPVIDALLVIVLPVLALYSGPQLCHIVILPG
jgi:hypothetical protein